MVNLAWGITGAADKLKATFEAMEKVAAIEGVRITTFITSAGIEVVLYHDLKDRLEAISNGDPFREICTPKTHGASTYIAARFYAGEYAALLVAPCSSNTLCKLRYGLADTPVTTAAMWALKGGKPVFVLQTHLSIAHFDSPLAVRVKEAECRRCDDCPPERACRHQAIARKSGFPLINVLKCRLCGDCVRVCPHDAIVSRERFRMNKRMVDQEAAEHLSEVKNVVILTETRQVFPTMQRYAIDLPDIRHDV